MTVQSFRAAAAAHSPDGATPEPIVFAIPVPDGVDDKGNRIERDELFSVPRPLPVTPFIEMSLRIAESPDAKTAAMAETLGTAKFFRATCPDDFERLMDAMTAARFGNPDIVELVRWLVQEDAGRPTTPSSGSSSSPSPDGGTDSNDGVSPKASPSRSKKNKD